MFLYILVTILHMHMHIECIISNLIGEQSEPTPLPIMLLGIHPHTGHQMTKNKLYTIPVIHYYNNYDF